MAEEVSTVQQEKYILQAENEELRQEAKRLRAEKVDLLNHIRQYERGAFVFTLLSFSGKRFLLCVTW